MQELWFLHSASYRADTMETRFCEGQSSKGNNSKNINARVTVLSLCTLSSIYGVGVTNMTPTSVCP